MGTALVGLALAAIVAAIVISQIKGKKSGKSSCGGNCAHCASGGCHSEASTPVLGHSLVLEIDGMMCPMCESHVNDAIRNHFQVKSVKSSHKTGLTEIISDQELDKEELKKVIAQTGYTLKFC